ncbi:hypothetical protein ACFPMF_24505 [Larkinella bovis]|uniref:ABC transporter permease n=1 Tax=Larkinella bovis TaxID=683041 RepID=A0ABW0IGU5_9BACT
MLRILRFALHRRFTTYFKDTKSVLGLIGRITYLLVMLLYAAGTGWLIDLVDTADRLSFDSGTLMASLNVVLCAFCVLVEFFPSYTQRSDLVSAVFPVRFVHRWTINVLYDSLTFTFTGACLAFFIIDGFSTRYTTAHLIASLLMLANTALFVQSFKAFMEQSHRRQGILLVGWAILNAALVWGSVQFYAQNRVLVAVLGLGLISQTSLLMLVDHTVAEPSESTVSIRRKLSVLSRLSPVYTVFIRNAKARNAFILGMVLKTVFLMLQGRLFAENIFMSDYIQKLYSTPLILFTYVANNLWILTILASNYLLTEVLLAVSAIGSSWYFAYRSVPENSTITKHRLYHNLFVKAE